MTNTAQLGSYGDVSGSPLVFRNKLINGGFDIWQRGTSQTTSGYGSDDRWGNENTGSTKTASRQTFTLGQTDVPGSPKFWSRTVVTTSAGASNFCNKIQRVESVLTLAGQTATLSFWAKADASKNIAVEFVQWFGLGGSPSSIVSGIGVTTCALTTSWQKFVVTVNVPSITGKTLGTDLGDFLAAVFWFDAGSTFNSRTNSLGQQSGTFDISNVQLEAGSVATPFEQRPVGTELVLCQRYLAYFAGNNDTFPGMVLTSATQALVLCKFPQPMRRAPVSGDFTISAAADVSCRLPSGTSTNATSVAFDGASRYAASIIPAGMSGLVAGNCTFSRIQNNGFVYFSAEL
jgi:hypothetical protein